MSDKTLSQTLQELSTQCREEEELHPVRCANTQCHANPKFARKKGRGQLLGKFPRGTWGEIQCPRCHHINHIVVE